MNQQEIVSNNYSWPIYRENGITITKLIENAWFKICPVFLPANLVQYVVLVCDKLKISSVSFQLSLSITSRFLQKKPNSFPLQLVVLSALLIATKFLQTNRPQLSELHRLSCNSFTSKDFFRVQKSIMISLNFDIMSEGVAGVRFRLVCNTVSKLMDQEQQFIFLSVLDDLERLAWFYFYTGKIKLKQDKYKNIPAALIHLALIFLTQFSGRFMQTLWACQLTSAKEKEVVALSNKILRQILGEEKSKLYKL